MAITCCCRPCIILHQKDFAGQADNTLAYITEKKEGTNIKAKPIEQHMQNEMDMQKQESNKGK